MQLEQVLNEVALVLRVAIQLGLARFPRPLQSTILLSQLAQQKSCIGLSDFPIILSI